MNELQIFNNPKFGELRTLEIDGEPWFVGNDVAKALGYVNVSDALAKHVHQEDIKLLTSQNATLENMPNRGLNFINESGLYSLIFGSKLESAKEFKHWVTSEVLPAIRKHGAYLTPDMIEKVVYNPDLIINLATQLKEEQEKSKVLTSQVAEMKPKALFSDAVSASHTSILIGELAKLLRQNGVETGGRRLFEWMRDNGYLGTCGSNYNIPTQRAMEMELFEIKETVIAHSDGHTSISRTPKVTGKGQNYFVNKFLN